METFERICCGGAEPLHKWLTESAYNLNLFEERRVVVVGIVGKSCSGTTTKADPINALLQRPVFFIHSTHPSGSTASIDAYYAPELSTLFLHLSGYGDLCALEYFLQNNKNNERKNFFECLSDLEIDYIRCLTFLLVYSHLLVYLEPGCRFDQSCCRDIKSANEIRLLIQKEICEKLENVTGFPRGWTLEGRLSQPRYLFAFHRHLLRGDLNTIRKRDLRMKLVEKLEQQIYHCMQLYEIATGDKDCPCGLSRTSKPFVHLFSTAESPRDVLRDNLLSLIERGNNKEETENNDENTPYDRFDGRDECFEFDDGNYNFGAFLQAHIELVRHDDDRKRFLYEVPKLKWLLTGGQLIYDLIFNTRAHRITNKIYKLSSNELQFSSSMENSYITRAKKAYQDKDMREFDRRKSPVFTKAEHLAKLAHAMEYLESIYHGIRLEKVKELLEEECEAIWATQKACEIISLTGNKCVLPIHHCLNDLNVPASERIAHTSGARFLSTCNCGHSQALRNDPFSLKEANFDFYAQSQFTCCKDTEQYEFEIFKEESVEMGLLELEGSAEKSQKSVTNSDITVGVSPSSVAEDDLEMLLDRDNRLQGEELHDESAQSPFRIEETDIDGISKELEEKKLSGSSEIEKCDEEQEQEINDDEEDYEETTDEEETEKSLPGLRRHKAHMDEYEIWSQEDDDMSPETQASYLDDDDVQLRELDVVAKTENKLHEFYVNSEEELARLRKMYRGQFLECVPNTESSNRKPLFASWSLLCLGTSSLYSHKAGLRDMPNFKNGTQFLVPVDVFVNVDPEKWDADMKEIMGDSYSVRSKRSVKVSTSSREKVKLFVGFEYECPRGHRFMIQDVPSNLTNLKISSKELGSALIRTDLPLWTKCTCRRMPQVCAQLMRLHVVTPKAPATVTLNPRVQPTSKEPIYHTGEATINLECARYYILRFPYVYSGPHGPVQRPNEATVLGKLLANSIDVVYIPKH